MLKLRVLFAVTIAIIHFDKVSTSTFLSHGNAGISFPVATHQPLGQQPGQQPGQQYYPTIYGMPPAGFRESTSNLHTTTPGQPPSPTAPLTMPTPTNTQHPHSHPSKIQPPATDPMNQQLPPTTNSNQEEQAGIDTMDCGKCSKRTMQFMICRAAVCCC